ncbi:MAG: rhodanese-like domain-containing protein [Chitinophagales bacterium]|nr:rhodanese-like domain-containing protein [Hyphomicrobiales bacterium]
MAATEELANGTLVLLSPEETKTLMDRGEALIIDVRNPDEFANGHIKGSLLHPLRQLDPRKIPEEADKKIVLLCAVGIRSKIAAETMFAAGRHPIAHLDGGLSAWIEAGLPLA